MRQRSRVGNNNSRRPRPVVFTFLGVPVAFRINERVPLIQRPSVSHCASGPGYRFSAEQEAKTEERAVSWERGAHTSGETIDTITALASGGELLITAA